jgi:transcriptional regulator with XRE-family HTH domain
MSIVVPTNAELGVVIRRLRRARHLTIEGLAHDAGMHPTYLSGIERGVRNPSWDKLAGLCQALDVPIIEMVRDAEDEARLAARMRVARSELGLDDRSE